MGTINVESKFQDEEDVGPTRSGSTFTVTIPVQRPAAPPHQTNGGDPPKIAIFHGGNERTFEGLTAAWEKFGYQVVVIDQLLDLLNMDLHYIWVDLPALKQRPHLLELLGKQTRSKVIIPYETQSSLLEVPWLGSSWVAHRPYTAADLVAQHQEESRRRSTAIKQSEYPRCPL